MIKSGDILSIYTYYLDQSKKGTSINLLTCNTPFNPYYLFYHYPQAVLCIHLGIKQKVEKKI